MSKRTITRDPIRSRQEQYHLLEASGQAQEALWDALALLKDQNINIGPKAEAILAKRAHIKARVPKNK